MGNPMSWKPTKSLIVLVAVTMAVGCSPIQPNYVNDTGNLSYYLEQATAIEYPDVQTAMLDEVTQAHRPMTVIDPEFQSFYDLTLENCVSMSLQNAKVLRGYGTPSLQGTRVSPGVDGLANGPAAAGTVYNVAIRETEPGFIGTPGQISSPSQTLTNTGLDVNQGVESALADFDAQFTSSAFWTTNDEPRNVDPLNGNQFDQNVFQQDTVQWQSELAKKTANGTQIFFRNINTWTENNVPLVGDPAPNTGFQNLDSWYRTSLELELRQPLLRGRGAFIQRMPIVISRIGTDQELANLEAQLQNMVTNVEIRYWDLYCAYRNFDAAKVGRDAALKTWRIVYDQYNEGADVNIQQVAQAGEQYHFFDSQVIDAYNNLLNAETALRWLLGLATTDGQIIRPIDEPVLAPIEFDWSGTLTEALSFRPELRQERWEVKKRELAVAYSKNALLPELNATALYRWLGLGNRYGTSNDNALNFADPSSGALNDLFGGEYQEFQLGITYGMPVGFRRELANVRNAQLKLAREIARIEDMELDVTREVSETLRALDANRRIMQSAFNRWTNTKTEEDHFEEITRLGLETLDVALDAQRRRSQAEIAFYTALCEYNKVLSLIHRRKGTTLAYNSISFNEGPWAGKAYHDAQAHARRRSASRQVNYGWTRPQVISQGENWPTAGAGTVGGNPAQVIGTNFDSQSINQQQIINQSYSDQGVPSYADEVIIQQPIDPSYAAPGTIIGTETPLYDGQIIDQPISTPSLPSERLPTPRIPSSGSSTRNEIPSKVQQASYNEEIRREVMQESARRAARKTSAVPKRDHATIQAKRIPKKVLKAAPQSRMQSQSQMQTVASAPSQPTSSFNPNPTIEAKPVVSRGIDWEKFGMSRPGNGPTRTQATIKTENN